MPCRSGERVESLWLRNIFQSAKQSTATHKFKDSQIEVLRMAVRFLQPLHLYTAKFPDTHVELDFHAALRLSPPAFRSHAFNPKRGRFRFFAQRHLKAIERHYLCVGEEPYNRTHSSVRRVRVGLPSFCHFPFLSAPSVVAPQAGTKTPQLPYRRFPFLRRRLGCCCFSASPASPSAAAARNPNYSFRFNLFL